MHNEFNEWDNASEDWLKSLKINEVRKNILIPKTLSLLGDIKGKKILDLGCGEGEYSRLFASRGANVVGIDYSQKLLDEAMKQDTENQVQYYVRDACHLDKIGDNEFDVIVSAMCLMAIENLQEVISESYRVLKSNGEFLVSILHPCFTVDDYFNECPYQEILSKHFGKPITFWHKTLSTTINCMISTGFILKLLNEPEFSIEDSQKPNLLIMKFTK